MKSNKNNKYYLPPHIKSYVKQELYNYKANKKLLCKLTAQKNGNTRDIAVISNKLALIEAALDTLSEEDKAIAEKIFFEDKSQGALEMQGVSRGVYYYIMDKTAYKTAYAFDMI